MIYLNRFTPKTLAKFITLALKKQALPKKAMLEKLGPG